MLDLPRNTTLYDLAKTTTYRAASRALFANKRAGFGGWGTNLQNINKWARRMYWADKGMVLCQRDQSGAEALIVAKLAPKGAFNDLFTYGIKPHVYVALHNFMAVWKIKCAGVDVEQFARTPIAQLRSLPGWKELEQLIKDSDDWAAAERYYFIAKMMCHSGNYDIGVNEFGMNTLEKSNGSVALSKTVAATYLENYHNLFPEIRQWQRDVRRQVVQTRTLFNLFGDPWYMSNKLDESRAKDWYAFVPQSTVGVITHSAITETQQFIEDTGVNWDILQNNHDSYMVQCPEGEWRQCHEVMKKHINRTLTAPSGEVFSMKSEGQCGLNWGPYKPKKNEDGLKLVDI